MIPFLSFEYAILLYFPVEMAGAGLSGRTRMWGIPGALALLALPVAGAYVGARNRPGNPGRNRRPA